MKIVLLSLVFLVSVVDPVQARLGENLSELVARYGEPLASIDQKAEGGKIASVLVAFQKNGFRIDVTLLNDLSGSESFKKLNGNPLTVEEVRTLLAANAQDHAWQAPQVINGEKQWMRDDGSMATLTGTRILQLSSQELLSREAAAKRLESAPSLNGF